MGDWNTPTDDTWIWWIQAQSDTVYERLENKSWNRWQRQNTQGPMARYHLPEPLPNEDVPTDLTRITTTQSRNRRYVYFHNAGNADFPIPVAHPTTLSQAFKLFPEPAQWALKYVWHSDNGATIADAIKRHSAIAVSDGSFKLGLGTAAFIIEADNHLHNIRGVNKVPGPIIDGDSHRCEVSGIYSTALIIEALCHINHITAGTITLACDNDASLKIFDTEYIPDPTDKNFDLVLATWTAIQRSPITWVGKEVAGHQDKHRSISNLDRFAQLNVAMDSLAKKFWLHLSPQNSPANIPTPDIHPIHGEGLQIWKGPVKVTRPFTNNLYGLITDESTQFWWVRHNNMPNTATNDVNWDAMERGLSKLPPARRRWTTKMASQECGVGTTLVRWKHQDDASCPRCGKEEDTAHVYQCQGCDASTVWTASIKRVKTYLAKTQTDPELGRCLIEGINGWRQGNPIDPQTHSQEFQHVLQSQANIGWQNY